MCKDKLSQTLKKNFTLAGIWAYDFRLIAQKEILAHHFSKTKALLKNNYKRNLSNREEEVSKGPN